MLESIVVAAITASATVICTIITSRRSANDMSHKLEINQREMAYKLEKQQAVTDTKIEELTREVRAHNNFAQRMPVVEQEIKNLNGTVGELRRYHME